MPVCANVFEDLDVTEELEIAGSFGVDDSPELDTVSHQKYFK